MRSFMGSNREVRLRDELQKVEATASFIILDMVAFVLADFEKAQMLDVKKDYLKDCPKLLAQLEDCIKQDSTAKRKEFVLIGALGLQSHTAPLGEVASLLVDVCR